MSATVPDWRLVTVAGVRMELPAAHPEVLLQESDAPWRQLRIPVGLAEGTAIAYALKAIPTPRPLTHELMADVFERHGVAVEALRITARQGAVFLAEIDTMGPRGRQVVPCRPSDGLALVLRRPLPTPVLVADEVFERAVVADEEAVSEAPVTEEEAVSEAPVTEEEAVSEAPATET